MTDAKMAMLDLVEQEADTDLVREMLAFAAEPMMELEIEAKTGAPAGSPSLDRLNHRNGYRERDWAIGIFLNAAAVIRLVGALMLEQNDEWAVSRRYMTLETIGALSDNPRFSLPALAA